MTSTIRRLRPLLISLVALILTAGIAFAAKPSTHPSDGYGSQASGQAVPEATEGQETAEPDESAEPDGPAKTNDPAEVDTKDGTTNTNCATDPTKLTAQQLNAMTHGSIVCWAAHQPTPDTYANHGAWVSHWAKQHVGKGAGHSKAP
ncbi:MAG: hypothetical protein HY264_10710 [Chloroflexi bacterium]|nr:hypothetical protein [Chloroflexota bacterium]